jgi:hypothetical protein
VKKVSSLSKTVSDTSSQHKSRLVRANEKRDVRLEPGRENFGNPFDSGVLQSNGPKVLRHTSIVFLGEENQVGTI